MEDVIRIFPENLDIKTGKTFIEGIKRVNPKKIITYWNDNILKLYETEISQGDITFFVNKDYRNDIGTEVQSLKVLEDIRNLVKGTTKEKIHVEEALRNQLFAMKAHVLRQNLVDSLKSKYAVSK